jgi:serine/threonine protein kinase
MIGTMIGEYRIIDRLGAGGMGDVYRGVHSKIGRVVAVKVLNQASCDPTFVERFYNEARIQASLQHPNVAALYDFIQFNNQPCIVMEYIEGETLTERICARGTLPVAEALSIFQSVVEAVHYVHGQGIIHRDIKSNNVKINPAGQVKLLDFGIAKSGASPALTVTGGFIGTLQYLSPELFKGGHADARSDIWSLGVLLYEMVTGHMAFAATTLGELYEKVSRASYAPPAVFNPSVPGQVEAIISRCLKKNPSDRYQSASELLQDVRRGLAQPAQASQPKTSLASTLFRRPARVAYDSPNVAPVADRQGGRNVIRTEPKPANKKPALALAAIAAVIVAAYLLVSQVLWPAAGGGEPLTNAGVTPLSAAPEEKTITVDLNGAPGRAEVYRDGSYIGVTPCSVKARARDKMALEFRLEGFAQKEELIVEPNRNTYTFRWKKND